MDKEPLHLLGFAQMSPEEKDLRAWIKLNAEALSKWDPAHIVSFALMNGFDRQLVMSVFSYFKDAMAGTHIENRAATQQWCFEQTFAKVRRMDDELKAKAAYVEELDLRPLWKDLDEYQTGKAA